MIPINFLANVPNNRIANAFFFVPFNRECSFSTAKPYLLHSNTEQSTNRHRTLNTTLILKLLICTLSNFWCFLLFFFFVFIIFQASLTRPGFHLIILFITSLTAYHFAFLRESSPTTYFTLALSQSPSLEACVFQSSQMHLSAYTFIDTFSTLIVPLHSLHFFTFALGHAVNSLSSKFTQSFCLTQNICLLHTMHPNMHITHTLICHWFCVSQIGAHGTNH